MSKLLYAALAVSLAAILVAACSPTAVLNALAESDASRTVTDIAYGSDPRQRLDIYVPAKPNAPCAPRLSRKISRWR